MYYTCEYATHVAAPTLSGGRSSPIHPGRSQKRLFREWMPPPSPPWFRARRQSITCYFPELEGGRGEKGGFSRIGLVKKVLPFSSFFPR